MIRLVVSGCCGRMGSLLVEEALKEPKVFKLVAGLEQDQHPQLGQPLAAAPEIRVASDLKGIVPEANLVVEFTTPQASLAHARIAAKLKVPILIGTTGFGPEEFDELRKLSREIPIFWSANMSTGVFLLRRTVEHLVGLLRQWNLMDQLQVKVREIHHAQKKDAPSGTAKQLAEDLARTLGCSKEKIPTEWRREGDRVGLHSVDLTLGAERITLEHEALDRRLFARGALVVAREFLKKGPQPGWYTMEDLFR